MMSDKGEKEPLIADLKGASLNSDEPVDDFEYHGLIICDPRHWSHRFIFLFLICFLSFGSYFVYDNPAALQDQFKADMDINTSQFMLMYSLYSWPNVVLCFIGGFLMDKVLGLRWGAILFAALVCVGQVVTAMGAVIDSYPLVLAGRFIFGLGGENLAVAQSTYAVSWFKGRELNMVFGLQLSFSRVGSTVNMITMKPIYDLVGNGHGGHAALGAALWIGAILCGVSLLTAVVAAWMDKRQIRLLNREAGKVGEEIQISDVKNFPLSFWLICLICVGYYVAIFPFIGLALTMYQEKWDITQGEASTVNSLVYIISAVASPLFGYAVDLWGRNLDWCLLSVIFTIAAHSMLAFTFWNPYAAVVVMGIAYSMLACALWPMVAYILPEHQLGTAYGFMQALQNLGLAVISMVAGIIVDSKGYLWLEVFFLAWLCLALMATVILYMDNIIKDGTLNMTAAQREAKLAKEEKELEQTKEMSTYKVVEVRTMTPFQLRNRYMSKLGVRIPQSARVHIGRSILK